jgi:hypothetical protein
LFVVVVVDVVVVELVAAVERKEDNKARCNTVRVFHVLPQSGLVWVHIQGLIQQVVYLD